MYFIRPEYSEVEETEQCGFIKDFESLLFGALKFVIKKSKKGRRFKRANNKPNKFSMLSDLINY